MKQAVMVAPGSIEFRDTPAPRPAAGQVLVRILRIGVCGSDVHVNHGKHPFTKYPVVQGHEFSAQVEAVGPGVTGFSPGQKVTATPQETCGQCRPCRRGRANVCENLKVRGFQAPGIAQEFAVIETEKLVALPDSMTPEQGAMVEPVAVAAHATKRAGDLAGRNVVVLGAGPIGNLVAQARKARDAKRVLITDLSDYRLGVAASVGIDATANAGKTPLKQAAASAFADEGFDLAFEAAGAEASVDQAIGAITKGGAIVIVGVFGRKPAVDLARVGEHELSLLGTMMYGREDYLQAVEWITSGKVQTAPLDSKHFAFEKYQDAYRHIDDHGDECMKVFIDM